MSVRSVFSRSAVFQSATPADRTSRRSSSVVGACAARAHVRAGVAMRAAKGREKCARQRGTEVQNKKEATCVLQGLDTEKWYRSCGRATAPATLALYKKKPRGSSPVLCKEGSVGACACANCCASAGGGEWQRRCDDSAVGTCALERLW